MIKIGKQIKVKQCSDEPELIGKSGIVIGYDTEPYKYQIQLDGKKEIDLFKTCELTELT